MDTMTTAAASTYTHEDVLKACLQYYNGDIMQASVTQNKYLLRDKSGVFHERTPDDMHDRLAQEFTRIELKLNSSLDSAAYYKRIRSLIDRFNKVVPQGSPMAAIGNPYQVQSLSNCMVIASPEDNIAGIFRSGSEIAELQKRRVGVGVDLSSLRPAGSVVNNAALYSSGVACFSDFYSNITRMIGQLGRIGALMITIDIKHPDVEHFARMKSDLTKVTGANVSIRISDEFMNAVDKNEEFTLQWPIDVPIEAATYSRKINARHLWDVIVEQAWKTAEPGLVMWDNYTKMLPAHQYPGYGCVSTNPCSEIALSPYDSCRLISLNLYGWVKDPFTREARFDFDEYFADTKVAQRMSDGLVELELEAIQRIMAIAGSPSEKEVWEKIWKAAFDGRRTGLGTHGLADVFLALGIRYDTNEAIALTEKIYETHKLASYTESVQMAKERGAFPVWDWEYDKRSAFIQELPETLQADIKQYGRRNISNLTIAPTGSVSLICGTSSGIEPVFRWVYDRRVKITHIDSGLPVDFVDVMGDKWTTFRVVHPVARRYFDARGMKCPVKDGRDFSIPVEKINAVIDEMLPKYFITSDKINYMKGIELQAAASKHIDHGVSKTINMPKGTKIEEVSEAYFKAWRCGLKGVTVYVDGSRDGVLISESTPKDNRPNVIIDNHAPKRPKSLVADIHHVKVKSKDWAVVVGLLDGKPYEVWAGQGLVLPKTNQIDSASVTRVASGKYKLAIKITGNGIEEHDDLREIYENNEERVINRSVCRELRHGVPIEFIIKDLADHSGSLAHFSAVLARVLKKYAKNANFLGKRCHQCSSTSFIMVDGCVQCTICANSKCN